jgi:hypothetical protein
LGRIGCPSVGDLLVEGGDIGLVGLDASRLRASMRHWCSVISPAKPARAENRGIDQLPDKPGALHADLRHAKLAKPHPGKRSSPARVAANSPVSLRTRRPRRAQPTITERSTSNSALSPQAG